MMVVKRYRGPSKGGMGSTMSTWMCPKRRGGGWKSLMPDSVCLVTLLDRQEMDNLAHHFTLLLIPCQMNFCFRSLAVEYPEG